MKPIIAILPMMVFLTVNCVDNKYSKIENEKILQGIIVMQASNSSSAAITCNSSTQFSSLASAGLSSRCGSCHSSSSPKGGVDVSSYTSVTAKVSSGNPEASLFYTAIKSGSMASYSDSTLNNAVYCWIKAGASQ